MVNVIGKEINMNRKMLTKGKIPTKRERLPILMTEKRGKICSFLSRDDNSRQLPGKNDYKKIGKEKMQKRVLNDYMANLWRKFSAENPDISVSLAFFCRCRPGHIFLTSFINRRRCLCIYHQNIALKLKASLTIRNPNPDSIFRQKTNESIINEIRTSVTTNTITYSIWKRVSLDEKTRTMCVQETKSKQEFIEDMESNVLKFREHIKRIAIQYSQIKRLKETLRKDHVVIHVDFAENYNCSSIDEVQSAYWNPNHISLHPSVLYYRDNNNKFLHKSFIFLSDDLQHNSAAVSCIISKLVPLVKEFVPDVKCAHFISDGPTSQYRNRFMMYNIANFETLYDIPSSTWTYLEVGHGKGPCDGVGGTGKRNADIGVNQGKAVIQSAADFHKWASTNHESSVKYVLYTTDEVNEKKKFLQDAKPLAVKNTLEIHAVCSKKPGYITVRQTSCFCDKCFSNGIMLCQCDDWRDQFVGVTGQDEASGHIRNSIDKHSLVVVYTDDPGESFYLLKAKAKATTLDKPDSDAWGSTFERGTEVVPGFYYQKCPDDDNAYTLIPRMLALVPIQSVMYVVRELTSSKRVVLPACVKRDIMDIFRFMNNTESEQ